MRIIWKGIISVTLIVSMLLCSIVPALAAGTGETYICELRLIYAEDYEEALEILEDSEFSDYKLYKTNLNQGSGEIGVFLAYKTTTDIEDAITDIAVMQMNGGYQEGNYQEMISESYDEYVAMGEIYLAAIKYFAEAYESGDFLAESAYRQLNFYDVVSEGIPEDDIPDFEGERLGDIFVDGISKYELATMFMQGNLYVLQNVRSLLAMGVSYNEDGKHYLEKVAEAVASVKANSSIFEDYDNYDEFDSIALLITGSILTFQNMFEELACYEADLNYQDDNLTDLEVKYAEYKSLADRMRAVKYLGEQTLYDFCMSYEFDEDEEDFAPLYPLVAALNDGQIAMTKVAHYYDVVRYSMSEYPEDALDEMVSEMEEIYSETPFNLYTGVDRSIYYGSFALTTEAYREDSYTEDGFLNFMFKDHTAWGASTVASAVGATTLGIWAIRRTLSETAAANQTAQELAAQFAQDKAAAIAAATQLKNTAAETASTLVAATKTEALGTVALQYGATYNDVVNAMVQKYLSNTADFWLNQNFSLKISAIASKQSVMNPTDLAIVKQMNGDFMHAWSAQSKVAETQLTNAQNMTQSVTSTSAVSGFTVALYIVGGVLMLYSAFSLGMTVYNYYHPDYEDVPIALVDLIETVDGDRYIKYDVVYNAEINDEGVYETADLNAFAGQRWNALYYTKSYEAGKPLLANSFSLSTSSNTAKTGYAPVHRFGEVSCYNLNKYNFSGNKTLYLSVKQSKYNKAAVDVPEVVGSMFGAGFLFLAGGIGAALGVGGTIATQGLLKKKKKSEKIPSTEGSENT